MAHLKTIDTFLSLIFFSSPCQRGFHILHAAAAGILLSTLRRRRHDDVGDALRRFRDAAAGRRSGANGRTLVDGKQLDNGWQRRIISWR